MPDAKRLAASLFAGAALLAIGTVRAQERQPFPLVSPYQVLPKEAGSLSRPVLPVGSPYDWIGSVDYPAADVAAREKGRVILRVSVAPDDAITGCRIEASTGTPAMEAVACARMRERGKFAHALSAAGEPVAGEAELSIEFTVLETPPVPVPPSPPPPPPGGYPYVPGWKPLQLPDWASFAPADKPSGDVAVELMIFPAAGAHPEMRSCHVTNGSGHEALDKATCDAVRAGQYARIPEAEPYRSNVQMLVRWKSGKAKWELPRRNRATAYALARGPDAWRLTLPESATRAAVARTTFRTDGRIACLITRSSGSDEADAQICSHLRALKFSPQIDLFGRKIPITWHYRFEPRR